MNRALEWLAKLPTTNARIAATILLAFATAGRYFAGGWEPSWEWLGFLIVMAGLDVTQFGAKRMTDASYVAAKQNAAPTPPPGPTA